MTNDAKPDAWMPLFIGDYKKDTGRLTRDQHGGYLLLIMEYWNTGPLQDDDEELAAIALADPREWRKLRPKLERFFIVADGLWRHSRIDRELDRWTERKAQAIERAKVAAAARWGGDDPKPRRRRRNDASSNAPGNAPSNASRTGQALLEQCPLPSPTEVDAHKGQSTLCGRDAPEARHEGASGLRVLEGGRSEQQAWIDAVRQAEIDHAHFAENDPDFASEIAEFLAFANGKIDSLSSVAA